MTPDDGCGELAEFPNFGNVQLLRRVQLLSHVPIYVMFADLSAFSTRPH
jgi:hypothetical protein